MRGDGQLCKVSFLLVTTRRRIESTCDCAVEFAGAALFASFAKGAGFDSPRCEFLSNAVAGARKSA